jgi:hypothetical protein
MEIHFHSLSTELHAADVAFPRRERIVRCKGLIKVGPGRGAPAEAVRGEFQSRGPDGHWHAHSCVVQIEYQTWRFN